MNFQTGAMSCTFGGVFAASELNPALAGNAQKLNCTALNNNRVVISRSEGAWLMRYGFVFMTDVVTSSWQRSWKLTQVQVQ
ncbi:MAG: hypothetical protein ACRETR_01345 [Steroidobacteraceae bacterium]